MKRFILTIIPVIFLSFHLNAQVFEWAKKMETEYVSSAKADMNGNLYSVGTYYDSCDFDPNVGVFMLNTINPTAHNAYVSKLDSNGNFVWAKQFAPPNSFTSGNSEAQRVGIDNSGNIYTSGFFYYQVDFDPGPLQALENGSTTNIFIQKMTPAGSYVYHKAIKSTTASLYLREQIIDTNSNIYLFGDFDGTVDFDPGAGTFNLTTASTCGFILKLDSNGNFLWAIKTPFTYQTAHQDASTNIVLSGYFSGTVDFDPGMGVFNLTSSGSTAYILKLSSSGAFIWAKKMFPTASTYQPEIWSMVTDTQRNIYTSGTFITTIDFNPGAPVNNLSSTVDAGYSPTQDFYIAKYDSSGNYVWAKKVGGVQTEGISALGIDHSQYIYLTSNFWGTVDFDPGIGIYNQTMVGGTEDNFVLKLNSNGNFVWVKTWSSTGYFCTNCYNVTPNIHVDGNRNILLSGNFYGNVDFDPDTGSYFISTTTPFTGNEYGNIFLLKLDQNNLCTNVTLHIDSASDVSCDTLGFISTDLQNAVSPITYLWNTMPVYSTPDVYINNSGIYSVHITDANTCERSRSVLINGPAFSAFDLNANLVTTCFRPGYNTHLWLDAFNYSCDSTNGQLKLVKDSLMTLISSFPAPDAIVGDTLIWDYDSMNFSTSHFTPHLMFHVSSLANIGDTVSFPLMITPFAGDADTTDNLKIYQFPIVNGYDPNDKKIYPVGSCSVGYLLDNEPITYTVRFQNTGNSDAINIYVLDTLDSHLDLHSVRIVGNSHPLITEILPGNVLKFRFDNIHLPDSNTNEALSHGYVIFDVMPESGVLNNTPISNTSHIFFDFNPPVTTNTVNNVLVSTIPNSTNTITQSFCNSININGYLYNTSGTFIQYQDNYLGCDSTITLNLTLLDSSSSNFSVTNCNNYTFNGITYSTTGIYQQTLLNAEGCDSIITLDLIINSVDNSVSLTGYTLTAQQPSATYQWIDCNNSNQPIPGETNQSFTATTNGNYAVIVTANGCSDTSACYAVFGFGLEDQNFSSGLIVSPNPTHSLLNITSKVELKNATLIVTDINGKNLSQKNELNGNSFQVDLSELNTGMYFIHIFSEGKKGILQVVKN